MHVESTVNDTAVEQSVRHSMYMVDPTVDVRTCGIDVIVDVCMWNRHNSRCVYVESMYVRVESRVESTVRQSTCVCVESTQQLMCGVDSRPCRSRVDVRTCGVESRESSQQSRFNSQQSTVESQESRVDSRANSRDSTVESRQSRFNSRQSTVEPTVEIQQSTVDSRQSRVESRESRVESRESSRESRVESRESTVEPTVEIQQSTVDSRISRIDPTVNTLHSTVNYTIQYAMPSRYNTHAHKHMLLHPLGNRGSRSTQHSYRKSCVTYRRPRGSTARIRGGYRTASSSTQSTRPHPDQRDTNPVNAPSASYSTRHKPAIQP